jgi:hypothetical protein
MHGRLASKMRLKVHLDSGPDVYIEVASLMALFIEV